MSSQTDIERSVDIAIQHVREAAPLLEVSSRESEHAYLDVHVDSFVRTVRDVATLIPPERERERESRRVLEVGSYLGVVSVALSELGYRVSALDIPEYQKSAALRSLYESHGVSFSGVNLRGRELAYESESLDGVVACEVIEHLNFNPLPFLQEANRVLKEGGYIYIGMPNQAHIVQRVKLLFGRSTSNSIDDFFWQLNPNVNMVVALHWREYTLAETKEMLERLGFEVDRAYYFTEMGSNKSLFRTIAKRLIYAIPSFRPYQVVVARKVASPEHDFCLTEANA